MIDQSRLSRADLEREIAQSRLSRAELEREFAKRIAAVPMGRVVLWQCGIAALMATMGVCYWQSGWRLALAPLALAVLVDRGIWHWRDAADLGVRMWAAAWASLVGWQAAAAAASWLAWLTAPIVAVRALLWLLVWVPLTTGIGTAAAVGGHWPLLVAVGFFSVQVVRGVWRSGLPPAMATANLFWVIGTIKFRAGVSLLSWRFLKAAQGRGAGILAQWLESGCSWSSMSATPEEVPRTPAGADGGGGPLDHQRGAM